jgi:hypothetical protein
MSACIIAQLGCTRTRLAGSMELFVKITIS